MSVSEIYLCRLDILSLCACVQYKVGSGETSLSLVVTLGYVSETLHFESHT